MPEALAWTLGYQFAQVIVCGLVAVGLLWTATRQFPSTLLEAVQVGDRLGWESSFVFIGVSSLASLLLILPLVRWRVGPAIRRALSPRPVSPAQLILIVAALIPLALLSDQLYALTLQLFSSLNTGLPAVERLARQDTIHLIRRQAASTAYPVLFVAIAIAPAIGEEVVFRGLIGNGLVRRWGLAGGILATSVLFAFAHGSPAHIVATLPVGVFLHFIYHATGNLKAPILLHCLNNGLAVTLMKFDGPLILERPPAVLFAAVGYLAVLCVLIVQWRSDRDSPPLTLSSRFPAIAGCSILAYTCVFVWSSLWGAA